MSSINLPPMDSTVVSPLAVPRINLKRKPRFGETLVRIILFLCAAVSILTTFGIVISLGREALLFFQFPGVTITEFFTGTDWSPQSAKFGVLPLVTATFTTSLIAMVVALPLGLAAAIYLSEYASFRMRAALKPVLEVLAGVPTVVYGFFALTFVTPLIRSVLGNDNISIYNMLSAGLVMGIMITPLVCSMSEDALHAVPDSLREGAYGVGSTKLEASLQVVVPAALSGIMAAVIVAISRAVGETMIVAIAAGAGPNFTFNPLQSAETMTGHIARISGGDLSYNSIDYDSLFAIGLLLFFITLVLNLVSRALVARLREVYE